MRTNDFLKQNPPEEKSWEGKITLSFNGPTAGWIQMAVTCTTYMQGVIVHISNAFDPFPAFARWLGDIAEGNLPSEFIIDEVYREKIFRATPVNKDEFVFEILEVLYDEDKSKEQPSFMYVRLTKAQFLSEFLKRWDDFLKDQYDPLHWEEFGVDLRKMDLSKVRVFAQE